LQGEAYTTCDTLPFLNFIELSISGDTKWLIKSGTPTNLDEIAANIQSEYTELLGDKGNSELLDIETEIAYFEGRVFIATNTIATLRKRRIQGLIDTLRNPQPDGLGLPFMYDDLETDLNRTEIFMKGEQMKLNRLIGQRDEMTAGNATGKATKKDWMARLMAIDKYRQTTPTNPSNITVLQFIVMDADLQAHIEYLKSQRQSTY